MTVKVPSNSASGSPHLVLLATVLLASAAVSSIRGDVAADASLGSKVSRGPDFVITGGRRFGGNLFHSFSRFDVSEGQFATLMCTGGEKNILARVTGGGSIINGAIRTATDSGMRSVAEGVNVFLLNPAGISFGVGARLDVGGSFTTTTADYLQLADGTRFTATPGAEDAVLTSASVTAFGFASGSPSPIRVSGAALNTGAGNLNLIGGDILIEKDAQLSSANAGSLRLASVGAADRRVDATYQGSPPSGRIDIQNSTLSAVGSEGGSVIIRAGKLSIKDSPAIVANAKKPGDGFDIDVREDLQVSNSSMEVHMLGDVDADVVKVTAATAVVQGKALGREPRSSEFRGDVRLTVEHGLLLQTGGRINGGIGGNVHVSAGSLSIFGENTTLATGIFGQTLDSGNGKLDVIVRGRTQIRERGLVQGSNAGTGKAGAVRLETGSLLISGKLTSDPGGGGAPDAPGQRIFIGQALTGILSGSTPDVSQTSDLSGEIKVIVHGRLTMVDAGRITSDSRNFGPGGDVSVRAGDVLIAGNNSSFFTGITALSLSVDGGPAGDIHLDVSGKMEITGGGGVNATTFAPGPGGNISVSAHEMTMSRGKSSVTAGISADTRSPEAVGKGGNVSVTVSRKLEIREGARISAATFGPAPGGTITVRAGHARITAKGSEFFTGISADTVSKSNAGRGGNVRLMVGGHLALEGGGRVRVDSFGPGAGGSVEVRAKSISISDDGSSLFTGISADAQGRTRGGNGGSIFVKARSLSLSGQNSAVSALSLGSGNAGSVRLKLDTLTLASDSQVASSNSGAGLAGSVEIDVESLVRLDSGGTISTSALRNDAGDVVIRSDFGIEMNDDSRIVAEAGRDGGNIRLFAPVFLRLFDSTIAAEAGFNGGDILIDPHLVLLANSRISANAILGRGGNILIVSDLFSASNSTITASSEQSVEGDVEIKGIVEVGSVLQLPEEHPGSVSQLRERCVLQFGDDFSSFVVVGRGGTEPQPEELLPAIPTDASR